MSSAAGPNSCPALRTGPTKSVRTIPGCVPQTNAPKTQRVPAEASTPVFNRLNSEADLRHQLRGSAAVRVAVVICGGCHPSDRSEESTVIEVAVRLCKVGVVEHIRSLQHDLQRASAFPTQRDVLVKTQVRVVIAGSMDQAASNIAECPDRLLRKRRVVEIGRRAGRLEGAPNIRFRNVE